MTGYEAVPDSLPTPSPTNHTTLGEVLSASASQLLVVIGMNCHYHRTGLGQSSSVLGTEGMTCKEHEIQDHFPGKPWK